MICWAEKVKIWELRYLKETPIDRIRQELAPGPEGIAPSWDTVNRVVNEFALLTRAQVRQLPDALQERWRELKPEAEQPAPREAIIEQKPFEETPHKLAEGREELVAQQLIQKWGNLFQNLSPIQLLQMELSNASQEGLSDFFTNRAEKELHDRARKRHLGGGMRLKLALESDLAYRSLRQRLPQSALLATLDASLHAWQGRISPYLDAFHDLMNQVKEWANLLIDSMPHEPVVDSGNLSARITNYRKQRAYEVLVTCNLLKHGLSELPSDRRWFLLWQDLEKMRVTLNLELSSLTGETRKGGWPTEAELIWTDVKDSCGLVQRTRTYLKEFVEVQSAWDSLKIALRELESKCEPPLL